MTMTNRLWWLGFVVAAIVLVAEAQINPKTNQLRTFGTAIKNGNLQTTEQTIFEHNCTGGGVVTELWMTGGWDGFNQTIVRIYIDGETTPSIEYQLYLAHGIGFGDDSTWQGSDITGKTAHGGGLYNTYRIPFGASIKITAALAYEADNTFWFIVRGLENMPVIIGDLVLPSDARLKLYKNEAVTLQPLEYTTLASVNSSAGALFMVTIEAESLDLNFLEACFRAYIDGASQPQFLSSGTEDFFLSAFYFNGGLFTTSQSGLTHFDVPSGGEQKISMYKFFQRDPVLFTDSFQLVWRNWEDGACPTQWPPNPTVEDIRPDAPMVNVMTYTSYVWVYEWSNN
eukprot:TRINITY_DN15143_c0_g1_i1.p1 TRINITY_DN15143_c0_g1~~TRINITY_DN15143_c0_g1_i1.p1  ORF type:complete len:367 (-),score=99.63 TRINITY_DN15143_c0_g1_i1:74-1096(-)